MEIIKLKENKVGSTICFEVRVPMKKPKIFMESFYVSFKNFILEEKEKKISMETPLKNRAYKKSVHPVTYGFIVLVSTPSPPSNW